MPRKPALLISYCFLKPFLKDQDRYEYRDWVMDSGAFSAFNSGIDISLEEYTGKCLELISQDPTLTEVFALDVIGDWRASVKNTEEMWRRGVPAIPCFHYGEPWELLKSLSRDYPKLALGGMVGKPPKERDQWIGQCFARVWPYKIHGFGMTREKVVMSFPWHSVDSSNWEKEPRRFRKWSSFGRAILKVPDKAPNLKAEIEWYIGLEERARRRWTREMASLNSDGPTLRLAVVAGGYALLREEVL